MARVAIPLAEMGARLSLTEAGTAPIKISGTGTLIGIDYQLPVASAQVKSCLLLAGMYADGQTCVSEPAPTRDHTERMLQAFGYPVSVAGNRICLEGGHKLKAAPITVPGDISSAAFFLVAACIAPGAELTIQNVGINPTRIGILEILKLMGADIQVQNERLFGGEPVADLKVKYGPLRGIRIPEELVPLAIDEFPVVFVAAACAEGETLLTGAEELRVKESDRIQAMADGLQALGIQADPTPDGIRVQGGTIRGGSVDSLGDHRIAMSFAVAALRAQQAIRIADCDNVRTSFPNFVELAQQVGLSISLA